MSGSRVVVLWTVGARCYAFPLDAVMEIVRPVWVTPMLDAPEHVLGVIQIRQALVPVFDLRARFGHEPSPLMCRNRFIVVRVGERPVAFVVDAVLDIVGIGENDVHGPEAFPATTLPAVIAAVFSLQGEVTALLDVEVAVTASDLARVDAGIRALAVAGESRPAAPPDDAVDGSRP